MRYYELPNLARRLRAMYGYEGPDPKDRSWPVHRIGEAREANYFCVRIAMAMSYAAMRRRINGE